MKYFVAVAYLATHFHASSASENERSWGWGGGGKPTNKPTNTPTKRPSGNTWAWGSSPWSNNGPTNWVWNGWGWNEAVSHNAWTGDGWNGSWNGKQTSAPTGTPSSFPSTVPSIFPSIVPSTSKSPSSLPSSTPSSSSVPSGTPTDQPTAQPTGTCCNAVALRQTILDRVYGGGDSSIFDSSPASDAITWLNTDACDCGQFCSEDQVVQRYILAVLYFSTNGNNWNSCSAPDNIQNDDDDTCEVLSSYGNNIISDDEGKTFSSGFKWLTCNTECEWGGINCNQNGLIIATDVEDNGLTGTLPNEVAALPRLFAFALEQNDISGTIPSTYSDLARLVILDLDFNSLEGSLLLDLSKMTKLRQLDLNNNNLEGTLGGLGWENTDLQFLDLSRNNFVGPIPTEIGDLPNLRSVQLYCNQLEAPLEWVNCPTADMVADDYICDDSSCKCTEEYTQETCTAKLASNKSG